MQPEVLPWTVWLAIALGALPGAMYLLRALRAHLHADALAAALRRLLAAGNAERALKLTRAAPGSPLTEAARAAIEQCLQGIPQNDPTQSYRDAGDLSPERVLAAVRRRYDAAFDEAARPVRSLRLPAVAGALILLGVMALVAARAHDTTGLAPAVVAAAFSLLATAWAARTDHRIERGRDTMFEALATNFDALIRDPRRAPVVETPARSRVRVEVSEPGQEPREVALDKDVIKIGTMPNAHVQLVSPGVARMHAVVEVSDDAVTLIDLGADAGTRVNGERVNKRDLRDGDVVTLGAAEMRVRIDPWR